MFAIIVCLALTGYSSLETKNVTAACCTSCISLWRCCPEFFTIGCLCGSDVCRASWGYDRKCQTLHKYNILCSVERQQRNMRCFEPTPAQTAPSHAGLVLPCQGRGVKCSVPGMCCWLILVCVLQATTRLTLHTTRLLNLHWKRVDCDHSGFAVGCRHQRVNQQELCFPCPKPLLMDYVAEQRHIVWCINVCMH